MCLVWLPTNSGFFTDLLYRLLTDQYYIVYQPFVHFFNRIIVLYIYRPILHCLPTCRALLTDLSCLLTDLFCLINRHIVPYKKTYFALLTDLSCLPYRLILSCLPTHHALFTDLSCINYRPIVFIYRPIVPCLPTYRALFTDLLCLV